MNTNKNVLFDKEYVKIKKETFDSMNKVVNNSTKVMNLQPKLEKIYNEVDNYSRSYQTLKNENNSYKKEIELLKYKNNKLYKENNTLKTHINTIFKAIKKFFRKLLQLGNDLVKETTTNEIKQHYDNNNFNEKDVVNISIDTTKEDELFDYVGYEKYYDRPRYNELDDECDKKDDFELSL